MFSLVEMKDSLANFLRGVVGAGLGAALAVLGSVYLYEKGRREGQAPMAADLHTTLEGVSSVSGNCERLRVLPLSEAWWHLLPKHSS